MVPGLDGVFLTNAKSVGLGGFRVSRIDLCYRSQRWTRQQPGRQFIERIAAATSQYLNSAIRQVDRVARYTKTLGFLVSDYYPEAGYFLRCRETAPHHQLFLLQHPKGASGLNHVAFSVRDIHEVFGGGLNISRQGWSTQLGPGRHPISSAYFWYVNSPTGGLFEYFADEDWCTVDWPAKAWERTPEHFAEWAIAGGLDGQSRRQLKPL